MKYLLIPSRHTIYSKEQEDALRAYLKEHSYESIIFAVTSHNLNNCKYSPVGIYERISMINSLIHVLQKEVSFKYRIATIPHFNQINEYAEAIVKYVNYNLHLDLTKENTEVFLFGAYINEEFKKAGYTTHLEKHIDHIELFHKLFVENDHAYFDEHISSSSKFVIDNQTEVLEDARKIWLDKVLQEKGSITDTRNYETYTHAMSNEAIIAFKYKDIKEHIVEGKIVDEGCADAALFIPIAKDFPDSDLIGVDISNDFIARANERIREGYFGNSFVNIIQANLLNKIFEDNFVNTVICNSTTHEIWSYNNKRESLDAYLKLKYNQLAPGGRLLIRDVIGGEKEKIVFMRSLEDNNELFKKFMSDFKHVRDVDTYEEIEIDGAAYIKANFKIISDYLLHKDYLDNWKSEMNEEFCHFNQDDWRQILTENNFKILRIDVYQSEWIRVKRFEGKIVLLGEDMKPTSYPNTNIVIVAEK